MFVWKPEDLFLMLLTAVSSENVDLLYFYNCFTQFKTTDTKGHTPKLVELGIDVSSRAGRHIWNPRVETRRLAWGFDHCLYVTIHCTFLFYLLFRIRINNIKKHVTSENITWPRKLSYFCETLTACVCPSVHNYILRTTVLTLAYCFFGFWPREGGFSVSRNMLLPYSVCTLRDGPNHFLQNTASSTWVNVVITEKTHSLKLLDSPTRSLHHKCRPHLWFFNFLSSSLQTWPPCEVASRAH